MSSKIIKKMTENYNEENLIDLDKHIERTSNQPTKPIVKMVVEHKGPTKVTVTEKSMKKLSKVILDL